MPIDTSPPVSGRSCAILGGALLAVSVAVVIGAPARAVPSFAQQTGQPCQACHVGGFGPQLTPFGRAFKLGGYTLRTSASIPVSAMAVASFTSTKRAQAAPPADGFDTNNNTAFDQGSIFLAGGIGSHFGGFVQTTYDGVAKSWSWDNLDLRAVGTGKIGGKDLVYGLSINNSPTVQDVWNTLPAWGYPYTSSALAPAPASGPLIAGGLAQNVLGVTAYAWLDSKFYLEAGGYSTPRAGTLRWLGADPLDPGDIHGLAPYGRVAFENQIGGGTLEVGAFLLKADLWPGRDRSAQLTDHYADVGVDASWLRTIGDDTLTLNARYTHEHRSLRATCALGIADGSIDPVPPGDCADGSLHEVRADASYYWHNKIGATIGAFDLAGTANPSLYPDSRTARPDSSGILLQLDGTPFGGNHSPLGQRFNMRVGVQYTAYTRFNGARLNYDGAGANAADNNTVRLFTWIAF
ncbi:hypothetical protein ABC974_11800 [Sphingomonas oligophenolica]|uniref:Cytochrome C n=1 Tax=Sphingomonas oligophenolica TaxID=301154 RepID=A0ABU9Y3C2_9SPHN